MLTVRVDQLEKKGNAKTFKNFYDFLHNGLSAMVQGSITKRDVVSYSSLTIAIT